jgi:hypothetical protein
MPTLGAQRAKLARCEGPPRRLDDVRRSRASPSVARLGARAMVPPCCDTRRHAGHRIIPAATVGRQDRGSVRSAGARGGRRTQNRPRTTTSNRRQSSMPLVAGLEVSSLDSGQRLTKKAHCDPRRPASISEPVVAAEATWRFRHTAACRTEWRPARGPTPRFPTSRRAATPRERSR